MEKAEALREEYQPSPPHPLPPPPPMSQPIFSLSLSLSSGLSFSLLNYSLCLPQRGFLNFSMCLTLGLQALSSASCWKWTAIPRSTVLWKCVISPLGSSINPWVSQLQPGKQGEYRVPRTLASSRGEQGKQFSEEGFKDSDKNLKIFCYLQLPCNHLVKSRLCKKKKIYIFKYFGAGLCTINLKLGKV